MFDFQTTEVPRARRCQRKTEEATAMNAGRDLEASRELLVVILVGTTEEVWMENRTMSRAQEHVTSIKVLRGGADSTPP